MRACVCVCVCVCARACGVWCVCTRSRMVCVCACGVWCVCARARAVCVRCVCACTGAAGRARGAPTRASSSVPAAWPAAAAACRCSSLQEQKGELRKRLSYTTHRLEKLENEFDSTRHFLEIELRRAQEELEKVTEKLRR